VAIVDSVSTGEQFLPTASTADCYANDGSERRIAPRALDKFETWTRNVTRRARGISLPHVVKER
jgi:hypothetical protein